MADGTTPSSSTSTTTTPSSVSSADVANANALNQAVSAIRKQLAANNSAQIAILNNIASAIGSSVIGGTTGGSANHVLISKGSTGFALQPSSVVTVDAPNSTLQVSLGVAGAAQEYFRSKPTDFATGKPYFFVKTGSSVTEWQFGLWDGTSSAGTLTGFSSILQHFPPLNQTSNAYLQTQASDSHFIRLFPSNAALGLNQIVQAGDECLIYAGNAIDTGNLVFGPWSSLSSGAGFRMDLSGISRYATEAGFPEQALTDAATITWNMNSQQCASVTLGGNRAMGTPTNPIAGFTYMLVVTQDGTGSRTLSFPDPPFKFPGGTTPVLSTAAGAVDLFSFYCHTTSFIMGSLLKAFS